PAGRFLVAQHLEARAFGLLRRSRTRTQRDRDILYATVAQVLRMGVTLAAVAEHGDLLVRDQVQVGVGVVVNLHRTFPISRHPRGNGDPVAVERYTRARCFAGFPLRGNDEAWLRYRRISKPLRRRASCRRFRSVRLRLAPADA